VTTGEWVARERDLPGGVITRVAASHLRVGTFQYFAARRDFEAVGLLTRYALDRHYPHADRSAGPALALLDAVLDAQADLVAAWMGVGFIHGVMNTDNTAISGETLDYGPCAFLDEYHPLKVFSSIDHGGRYAFARQPEIARWNLSRLAETLLPLIDDDVERARSLATARLERFAERFADAHERVLGRKLGFSRREDGDRSLAAGLFEQMAASRVDFTVFFRRLSAAAERPAAERPAAEDAVAELFADSSGFGSWMTKWRERLAKEEQPAASRAALMRKANPAVIPRNHRVEQMIQAALATRDLEPFERLVAVLARPYDDQPGAADLAEPPAPDERVQQTFCGT
jgi:uncharacterized protein YdiU (UPF0061 family)